jgi:hypothetical protein
VEAPIRWWWLKSSRAGRSRGAVELWFSTPTTPSHGTKAFTPSGGGRGEGQGGSEVVSTLSLLPVLRQWWLGLRARWIRERERLGYIGAERCNRPRTSTIWLRSPRIPIISHGRYELTESAHGKGKTGRVRLSDSGTRYTAPMVSTV